MSETNITMAELEAIVAGNTAGINESWHLVAGILVFMMQAGFALLEVGSVQSTNAQNILFKNILDACISAICFWLLGYGFAYGQDAGGFIGTSYFALADPSFTATASPDTDGLNFHTFFFQWCFAATAATIVSGSVAERCALSAYLAYSAIITTFVYPIVVHWGWGEGFMSAFASEGSRYMFNGEKSNNFVDFAGSGIVHMVGGFSGLMGAIFLGPRKGRFLDDGTVVDKPGHNTVLATIGVLILWVGWYGFNAGSTLCMAGGCSKLASKVAMTTTLAPAAACLAATLYTYYTTKGWDLTVAGNAILAGLVSITASCAVVEPIGAFFIGIIGAVVYLLAKKMLLKLQVDDPLDAVPVHGFCGFWGCLSVGIFGTDENAAFAGYKGSSAGYPVFASAEQFGVQVVGALAICSWTVLTSGLLFYGLKRLNLLRVSDEVEAAGLDLSEHGGTAYNMTKQILTQSIELPNEHCDVANNIAGDDGRQEGKISAEKVDLDDVAVDAEERKTSSEKVNPKDVKVVETA